MPTKEDFEMALALARKAFGQGDVRLQAEKAGLSWVVSDRPGEEGGQAEIRFLGTSYLIQGPSGEVCYKEEEEGREPALWEKILLLHYFNTSDGSPLTGTHISFKEVRDAMLYLPNFEKRAISPLLSRFGGNPQEIWEAARVLEGRKEELGDFSVTIPVFPCVPVTLVFWKGDEEFGARLSVLFDKSVLRYLPTEDIVLSTQMLAFRLIGLAQKRRA